MSRRYRAFISYSHADEAWARWLMRRLETYRVPRRLVGTDGAHGRIESRLGAFFRDRDELTASGDLGATIREALAASEWLVVVCSPAAARSRWVDAEVAAFRASGRGDRVLCFVVDGEPGAGEAGCFPPSLLGADVDGRALEPLAADARAVADGRDRAFLKLVAALLGVGYDTLARRDLQRRHRRLVAVAAASLAGMAIATALAVTASIARDDAQRRQAQAEDLLGFMLGDLREKLATVGRLDLMRTVDTKAIGYFAALQPRDLSDRALAEQARSLTGIGQVRLQEGSHAEAMAAFTEAHARSVALQARAPGDGQRLFDLAQAEYWIGYVAWQQGRLDEAGTWLRRYRDSAVRLAAMDPGNFDWQREVAYGHHNLAVLDDSLGRYDEAERAMRDELALYRAWTRARPTDTALRFEAANVASWLGGLMLRQGRLAEAEAFFAEEIRGMALNARAEPKDPKWRNEQAEALLLLAETLAMQGNTAAARTHADAACGLASDLARHDPANNDWRAGLGICRLAQAQLAAPAGSGVDPLQTAMTLLSAAHAAEPKNERKRIWLARAHLFAAQRALAEGEPGRAGPHAALAVGALEPAWRVEQNDRLRLWLGWARLVQGDIASARGDGASASTSWREAHALLHDGQEPPPFAHLEPLVRALSALGQGAEATPHRARLDRARYVPSRPWPPAPASPGA